MKGTSAGTWYTFRDLDGNPVYEFKTGGGGGFLVYNHYFQGRLVFTNSALASPTQQWIYTDHLGSPRLPANASGGETSRHWYYPYGEEFQPPANPITYRYNAKPRDAETGLHDYGARYYDTLTGRFRSVDPARGDVSDPQTWNRYIFTSNNPMSRIDPDGRKWFRKDGEEPIWVEANEDGSYTSPGEGWEGWEPTEDEPVLLGVEYDGQGYMVYGVDGKGRPVAAFVVTGGLEDATGDFLFLAGLPRLAVSFGQSIARGGLRGMAGGLAEVGIAAGGRNFRREAAQMGSTLVKKFKVEGIGRLAGRSGGHGDVYKRAGAELARMAKREPDKLLREAMKIEAGRLILKGKSISHK